MLELRFREVADIISCFYRKAFSSKELEILKLLLKTATQHFDIQNKEKIQFIKNSKQVYAFSILLHNAYQCI